MKKLVSNTTIVESHKHPNISEQDWHTVKGFVNMCMWIYECLHYLSFEEDSLLR